jgi:hypothetical protein
MSVAVGTHSGFKLRTRRLQIRILPRVLATEEAIDEVCRRHRFAKRWRLGFYVLPRIRRGGFSSLLDAVSQKLATVDSAIRFAISTGPMRDAFIVLRSSSVTPRATEQGPQTYTGTFPSIIFSIKFERGGKPTP